MNGSLQTHKLELLTRTYAKVYIIMHMLLASFHRVPHMYQYRLYVNNLVTPTIETLY